MTQRDIWDNDDCVGFAFDPYNTEQESFLFNINPYGIPLDFIWHHDGYLDKVPSDPWGSKYIYMSPGADSREYDLKSYGKDGEDGGTEDNADIERWNLDE